MSLLEEITPSPRKVMTLFYLVDTSGSMGGSRIGTVNAAMEECIPLLKEVAAANDDAEIKVAILPILKRMFMGYTCIWTGRS